MPDRRTPVLSFGDVELVEGDVKGPVRARLPYTVAGDVSRPSRFVVLTAGQERGSLARYAVDLAAGQTSGSIPVQYFADTRDDHSPALTQLAAWATEDLMTDVYVASLAVEDDDPAPVVSVAALATTVEEGDPVVVEVRLDRWVDYDLFVVGKVINGPGRELVGADVPQRWLERYGAVYDPDKPLNRLPTFVYDQLRTGGKRLQLTIPTRNDSLREGRETVTLKLNINRVRYVRTVVIAPSD